MPPRKKSMSAKPAKKAAQPAPKKVRAATAKATVTPPQKVNALKPKKDTQVDAASASSEKAQVLSSQVVFQGPLFRVTRDSIVEPTGLRSQRDLVRHNGSVVIMAIDRSKSKKNPWVVMERQYRHAANQFLWELPAGKLEAGEDPLEGAKRELAEETGYQAKRWSKLVEYWPSPGFLGEAMLVYLAEELYAGEATPEDDERIEIRLVKLSEILELIEKGGIHDGKTLNAALLYAWMHGRKRKK